MGGSYGVDVSLVEPSNSGFGMGRCACVVHHPNPSICV